MMKTLDTEHYDARLAAAKELLADHLHMRDFSYWGGLALGETWASTMTVHRDSDIREQSNFAVIRSDMEARFPDDVAVECWNHWEVGHVDHLAVRLLTEEGALTDAGHAILEWRERLDDYRVADEDDLSEREHEALWDNFECDLAEYVVREGLPDDWQRQVFDAAAPELFNDGSNDYSTDLRDELFALGFLALSELERSRTTTSATQPFTDTSSNSRMANASGLRPVAYTDAGS